MDVMVSSRHAELSPAVREMATDKITRLGRFLDGMDRAEVHFDQTRNPSIDRPVLCEVSMHGHGLQVRAKVSATDHATAVDAVVDKLEQQLHRLKTRLLDRHHGRGHLGRGEPSTRPPVPEPGAQPVVPVRTKRFEMRPMTVQEAAFQMELLSHPFFVFVRADTGETAVLYHREQGGLGLIEVSASA
jgi:putative sigma-54 modulation protein